jgi:hypothetical protein
MSAPTENRCPKCFHKLSSKPHSAFSTYWWCANPECDGWSLEPRSEPHEVNDYNLLQLRAEAAEKTCAFMQNLILIQPKLLEYVHLNGSLVKGLEERIRQNPSEYSDSLLAALDAARKEAGL